MSRPRARLDQGMTLSQALSAIATTYPRREAVVCGSARLTFAELEDGVNRLACGLTKLGIKPGDRVVLLLRNGLPFVWSFFAVLRVGGVVVPLDPRLQRPEIAAILHSAAPVAVVSERHAPGLDLGTAIGSLRRESASLRLAIFTGEGPIADGLTLGEVMGATGSASPPQLGLRAPDDLAVIFYTSGTTGIPQAVQHTHGRLLAAVLLTVRVRHAFFQELSVRRAAALAGMLWRHHVHAVRAIRQQTWLTPMPFSGMSGYTVLIQALLAGDRLVVMEQFHPVDALQLIEHERVTFFSGSPTILTVMLGSQAAHHCDLSSLLLVGLGAAPTPADLVRRVRADFGCAVVVGYGATELAGGVIATRLEDPDTPQPASVGKPLPGVEVKVVDDARQGLPPGCIGELACRVGGVTTDHAPDGTMAGLDRDGWYYTGDLATIDEGGSVRIVGRKRDLIIRGGQNIFPSDIERELERHPNVRRAAVVGLPDGVIGESVWAFVVRQPNSELTEVDLLLYCHGKLAAHKIPNAVRFLDALPMTESGEVRKFLLRQELLKEVVDRDSPSFRASVPAAEPSVVTGG